MDANGDGKLTKDEVKSVEKLLATRDADEDECLTPAELVGNNQFDRRIPLTGSADGCTGHGPRAQNVAIFDLDRIPGTMAQRILLPAVPGARPRLGSRP